MEDHSGSFPSCQGTRQVPELPDPSAPLPETQGLARTPLEGFERGFGEPKVLPRPALSSGGSDRPLGAATAAGSRRGGGGPLLPGVVTGRAEIQLGTGSRSSGPPAGGGLAPCLPSSSLTVGASRAGTPGAPLELQISAEHRTSEPPAEVVDVTPAPPMPPAAAAAAGSSPRTAASAPPSLGVDAGASARAAAAEPPATAGAGRMPGGDSRSAGGGVETGAADARPAGVGAAARAATAAERPPGHGVPIGGGGDSVPARLSHGVRECSGSPDAINSGTGIGHAAGNSGEVQAGARTFSTVPLLRYGPGTLYMMGLRTQLFIP